MFDSLFSPKNEKGFWESFHRRERFVLSNKQKLYSSILTIDELNAFFKRRDIPYPTVQLAQDGKIIPGENYTCQVTENKFIDNSLFFSLFNKGNSIVIYHADHFFDNLYNTCRDMESVFNFKVVPTIFISPQKEQATVPHYDSNDSIICQLYGVKTWPIYKNSINDLPLDEENSFMSESEIFVNEGLEDEIILKEGDLLFLPRGVVHHPSTLSKISIHISFVLEVPTFYDVIRSVSKSLKRQRNLRKNPMFPGFKNTNIEKYLKDQFKQFDFSEPLKKYFAIDSIKKDFKNRFADIVKINSDELYSHSKLEIRTLPTIVAMSEDGKQFVRIGFFDNYIDYPLEIKESLEFISQHSKFKVSEIPSLNESQQISLCFELIQEGFLVYQ